VADDAISVPRPNRTRIRVQPPVQQNLAVLIPAGGGALGCGLAWIGLSHRDRWPLVTGGMPIFGLVAGNIIIMFELTMLGAIIRDSCKVCW